MNKSAIQKFAVWARRELIEQVSQRAYQYGVTAQGYGSPEDTVVNGRVLSDDEKKQRKELIRQIQSKGYDQVMEEVAYTWFNRFIALRFMEVNNYLPAHIRVFSDVNGNFKPEIISAALSIDLPGLDRDKVIRYIDGNQEDDLYRYLLLTQCNALNKPLPLMFEKMGSYTELLLPNNILREDGVIGRMVSDIPEEDWTDQVQIIGWLYQYYNAELKDETFALLKKNVKITKERIPSATQLFTPEWIVRYMVENSLGRLWIEGHPDEELRSEWKYYLDEAEQEPQVQAQLAKIRAEYAALKPQDIRLIDPCMGSGHILSYAFDIMIRIYEKSGVSRRDAAKSIVENNLYGLDIDERASQLAYFAVMMKGCQYDRRFLSRGAQPKVYAIPESNDLDNETVDYFINNDSKIQKDFGTIVREFRDAKEYGSILNISPADFDLLYARVEEVRDDISLYRQNVLEQILPLIQAAEVMSAKYDVVVTNPPYMGASGMGAKLSEFVKKNYPDSKSDLFACFITKGNQMIRQNRYNSMVTMQSWMFLSSFEKMRTDIIKKLDIVALMHMENMVMHIAFGTAVAIFRASHIGGYKGTYNQIKLKDLKDDVPIEFPIKENRFSQVCTDNFSKIPGSPVAYWVGDGLLKAFADGKSLDQIALARNGMKTGENERFVRLWWEVIKKSLNLCAKDWKDAVTSKAKWFPYNKGGEYRKWYGNNDYIVNWENQGNEIFNHAKADKRNVQDYPLELKFVPSVSWSLVTSGQPAFRYKVFNLSDIAGMSFLTKEPDLSQLLGFCNSRIALEVLRILSPTINFQAGDIGRLPIVNYGNKSELICELTAANVRESKNDWDSYETSWDFKKHPMV